VCPASEGSAEVVGRDARPVAAAPQVLRFGPFRLDRSRGTLERGSEEVLLTPKAYDLLVHLLDRPGVLLSKRQLIDALWPGIYVDENNLSQQIATLRRALGDGWIETRRGRGFRFVGPVDLAGENDVSLPASPIIPSPFPPTPSADTGPSTRLRAAVVALALIAAAAIGFGLSRREPAAAASAAIDPRAREEYQLGRFAWNRRTRADMAIAETHFRRALELEPRYAAAWSGLGDSLNLRGRSIEGEQAARRALELDEGLAEAHATLGNVLLFRDWNLDDAEAEFDRALALDPSYVTARHWRAFLFLARGDLERAIEEIERARQLEPLSRILATDGAHILYFARRYEAAELQIDATLKLDPHFGQAYNVKAEILAATGRPEEALAVHRRAAEFGVGQGVVLAERLARAGRSAEARALLAQAELPSGETAYARARLRFALGEVDAGYAELARGVAEHVPDLLWARSDPLFDGLREDPRWPARLR
jgi:DNA-binding winged helix-turn-helix (wHTH) protein/Tfp pilus assembly protein PilF